MPTVSSPDITSPPISEIPKVNLQKNTEKQVTQKFLQAREKTNDFAKGISGAFRNLRTFAKNADLQTEIQEMDQLSKELQDLNAKTTKAFGLKDTTIGSTENLALPKDEASDTPPEHGRVVKRITELLKRPMSSEHGFPVTGILGDGDKIEGQNIDLINQGDRVLVYFKTTAWTTEQIVNKIIPSLSPDIVSDGALSFRQLDGNELQDKGYLPDAWIIHVDDNTRIRISKGGITKTEDLPDYDKDPIVDENGVFVDHQKTRRTYTKEIRTMQNVVSIEVSGDTDPQKITNKFATAMKMIGIPDGLTEPSAEAERAYKVARFRWQHRLDDDPTWEAYQQNYQEKAGRDIMDVLVRQEVLPGYETIVEPGACDRYEKKGPVYLYHGLSDADVLMSVFKNGLLSSHERFKRGNFAQGQSTETDFDSGGADNVFFRLLPSNRADNGYNSPILPKLSIIADSDILDRTDWYGNWGDNYGIRFQDHVSAEEFIDKQFTDPTLTEVMFRRGVPVEKFSRVIAKDATIRDEVLLKCRSKGITEINGIPIEAFITVHASMKDFLWSQRGQLTNAKVQAKQQISKVKSKIKNSLR